MQKNPRGYKEPRTYLPIAKPLGSRSPLPLQFLAAAKIVDVVSGTDTSMLAKELGSSLAELRAKERQCDRRLPLVDEDAYDQEMFFAQDYATFVLKDRISKVCTVSSCLDAVLLPLYFNAALSLVPIPTALEEYSYEQLGKDLEWLEHALEHFNQSRKAYKRLLARVHPQGNVPRDYVEDLIKMRRQGNVYAKNVGDLVTEISWRSKIIRHPPKEVCGIAVSILIAVVELAKTTDKRTESIINDTEFLGTWEEFDML